MKGIAKIRTISNSNWILSFLTILLTVCLLVATSSVIMEQALTESFMMKTFDKIDFYNTFDEIYIKDNFKNIEDAPQGRRTLNYLLSEVDRSRVLEDNAQKIVPDVLNYLKGEEETLNLMLSVGVLESELKAQLDDYESFKRILELEAPDQARIFTSLPDEFQKNFYDVIKEDLIDQIQLPQQLPLSYFIVEDEITETLTTIKSIVNLIREFSAVATVGIGLTGIPLLVLGKLKGILMVGISLFVSGLIFITAPVFLNIKGLIENYTEAGEGAPLLAAILKEALHSGLTISYGFVFLGIACILGAIVIIYKKHKQNFD
ncbi:hypothetical protein [Natranaerobius thermophilus]|uniref:Uncharacterized protein n=1 Tax=Natranaerobius thermophilus (strain ATCC BAA-1301 / DSM 18059 / JW/NM-WN-LF) TaxID=457570 RepID=B2A6T4_NATTJ|nr:hypothetical protein [Natranaerobius thermophilus]ACB84215.1 hypothetical protein Nther_0620 [Natranaerobius thermophilus JW/NM-WN-LF]